MSALESQVYEKDEFAFKQDIFEIKVEIKEAKAEMIKWSFIFTMGQFLALAGLMITLFNVFFKR